MRREDQGQPEPNIPDHLADDLRRLTRVETQAPEVFEDELLSMARRRLDRSSRLRIHFRRAAPLAAAAGLAITGWIGLWVLKGGSIAPNTTLSPSQATLASVYDVDDSGRVDVLDAFLVASTLDRGGRPEPAWDVTGDGRIGPADVDAIAAAAVSVAKDSRS